MGKRKNEISIMNVWLCLIVILIHLVSKPITELGSDTLLYKPFVIISRLSAFVVQGFIFLSGMKLFLNSRRKAYASFMINRIKLILIPYIAAVFIYYLYFVYIEKYFPFSIKDFGLYLIRGDLAAHFYFVIAIMQFYLLYPLWRILSEKRPVYILIISTVITVVMGLYGDYLLNNIFHASFMYTDRIFTTYLIYWVAGMFAGKYYDSFIEFIKKHGAILILAAIVMGAIDGLTFLANKYSLISGLHLNALHAVYCIFAISALMSVSYTLQNIQNRLLQIIDRASYYIYLLHILFIFITDRYININSTTLSFAVRSAIVYGMSIALAYVYTLIKRKN